jgi:hypothetical protein
MNEPQQRLTWDWMQYEVVWPALTVATDDTHPGEPPARVRFSARYDPARAEYWVMLPSCNAFTLTAEAVDRYMEKHEYEELPALYGMAHYFHTEAQMSDAQRQGYA